MPFGFSARPVQIATCNFPPRSCDLFTLPPHAPCRLQPFYNLDHDTAFDFASTRSVQIATGVTLRSPFAIRLCLHTLRADCNSADDVECLLQHALPPHAPCRLQLEVRLQLAHLIRLCLHTLRADCNRAPYTECLSTGYFASTRSVQIATAARNLRASPGPALPPHAPCRLQHFWHIV